MKYFVATDTPQGRKAARQFLGDQVFFYKDFQISNNPEGVQRALLDILLLAAAKVSGCRRVQYCMAVMGIGLCFVGLPSNPSLPYLHPEFLGLVKLGP